MTAVHRLISDIAKETVDRITRRVISKLQRLKNGLLSGDDSGLENTWDEICAQKQSEESFYWEAYDETVRAIVSQQLNEVSRTQLQAIWLQTDAGMDWLVDHDEDAPLDVPLDRDDVLNYVVDELYQLAENWSNRRIRAFLDSNW